MKSGSDSTYLAVKANLIRKDAEMYASHLKYAAVATMALAFSAVLTLGACSKTADEKPKSAAYPAPATSPAPASGASAPSN